MNTNQPDELQKTFDQVESSLMHCKKYGWTSSTIDASQLQLIYDAAKQLQQVEKELKQERIWKEEDPRMLREQMRVHDVAFQHLHEQNKELNDRLEHRGAAYVKLEQESDQLKAALDKWSNAELMGETERCQFDALKVQNNELKAAVEMLAKALKEIDDDLKENMPEYERLDSTKEALDIPIVQQICNPATTQCQPQAPAPKHQT